MDDRRNARRFAMNLPVDIKPEVGSAETFTTETRDVSFGGLYFIVDRDFQSGSSIEFILTLPREITGAGDVRIHCLGRVARVERPTAPGPLGVAATIDRYEFLPQAS